MYLKNIKAIGFKSFADKTNIEFNNQITAIVGPNGSGKSNIVDAIRWVLGEQSAKSLRATTIMSDVIFSGSTSREGMKKASVALVFDNTDRYLNSDFDEIEIKREVYKTGENDYFINNTKVRLKDVQNLFLDTGVGQSAFNIISQGNITDIVNSKPFERRIIFESAAGVLKYKKRKEESLRKLEKTKLNLASIKLVIDELANTVLPLKKQSEDALRYLALKEEVENIEIALIVQDIGEFYLNYNNLKSEIDNLYNKINIFVKEIDTSKIEKMKLENVKIDEQINILNQELIKLNEQLAKLSSEKQILSERQKLNTDKELINENLIKVKEEHLELGKKINIILADLETLKKEKNNLLTKISDLSNKILTLRVKKTNLSASIDNQNRNTMYLQNKIEIVENNILNKDGLPKSVKNILNNPRLNKVHDTIGNLIEVPLDYSKAIEVALGFSAHFLVVDDFLAAKECINYLKSHNLGRATFFPLDTIKSRYIDNVTLNLIKSLNIIGIASDLLQYDNKFKNIIENQLGNVIVVKDIDTMNLIGKKINYKYRIVSLDGEVLYSGGSIAGGNQNSLGNFQNELKKLTDNLFKEKLVLKNLNEQYKILDEEYNALSDESDLLNKKLSIVSENIYNKEFYYEEQKLLFSNKSSEIEGMNVIINNSFEADMIKIIENYNKLSEEKIIKEKELNNLKNNKYELQNEINTLENTCKIKNNEYNLLNADLKQNEIEIGKIEVKLENLLLTLSEEYNLTYEAALDKYFLDMDTELARKKVKSVKKNMELLGEVNLGSIKEYERLSTRYNFLLNQEKDLNESSNSLINIISEMDKIMIEKFELSFKEIAHEFKIIFKQIFQGGKGELLLTDPDDLLNTGIEIIAIPPGKKLNSTISLSGGEKSLTAISLLFSILNVRPVPFVVLDEAEASLDESNVDLFGKYLNIKKEQSQFILITHKKRMMEYADTLYGITMQESGISKIVSTKLTV